MTKPLPPGAPRKKPGVRTGHRGKNAQTSARNVAAKQKQAEAVQLRLAGANLTEIARQVGYADPSGAYRAIQAALSVMLPDETRDQARRRELATIDRMQMAAWTGALRGDEKAIGVVLRCVAQRCRLLGLEAPQEVVLGGGDGQPIRVELAFDPSPSSERRPRPAVQVIDIDPSLISDDKPVGETSA